MEVKDPELALSEVRALISRDQTTSNKLTADERAQLASTVQLLSEMAVVKLMRSRDGGDVFWANLLLFIKKNIDFKLPAATAVSIAQTKPELYINPYLLLDRATNFAELTASIKHEGYHLLYNHLAIYRHYMTGPEAPLVNDATDAEINQHLPDMPAGQMTLAKLAKHLALPKLDALRGSYYYFGLLRDQAARDDDQDDSDRRDSQDQSAGKQNKKPQAADKKPSDSDQAQDTSASADAITREEDPDNRHQQWAKGSENEDEIREATRQFINHVNQATEEILSSTTARGSIGTDIQSAIQKLNEPPRLKWQSRLKRALSYTPLDKKKTITRLNRRFPDRLEMRGRITGEGKEIYAFIDTSASMADSDIAYAMNEVTALAKQHAARLFVGEIDTQIHALKEIKRKKDIHYTITGRGGTRLQPIFDALSEQKIDKRAIITIFTDGYIEPKIDTKQYPHVLWVLNNEKNLSEFKQFVITKGEKLALRVERHQ